MKRKTVAKFVVCISNEGYQASLEPRKIYQVVPDKEAESRKMLRVIDESGEDYLSLPVFSRRSHCRRP